MAQAEKREQNLLAGDAIHGERERALRLLEELTPRLVKFRQAMRMLATDMSSPTSARAGHSRFGKATSPGWTPS